MPNTAFLLIFSFTVIGAASAVCPNLPGIVLEYLPGSCVYVREAPIFKRDDANNACLQLGPQTNTWRLPRPDTEQKSDKINEAIKNITSKGDWIMWLDLVRDEPTTEAEKRDKSLWASSSKWRWSSNSTLEHGSFSPWNEDEPNNQPNAGNERSSDTPSDDDEPHRREGNVLERCVTSRNKRWNDAPCDVSAWNWVYENSLILVCEYDVPSANNADDGATSSDP